MTTQVIRRTSIGFFLCFSVLLCSIVCAGMSDNFALTVRTGQTPVEPNPASVKEDVTFQFVTELLNKQTGKEAKPEDVKSVLYTLSSDVPEIKSSSPAITISPDTKSASGSADLLQDVTATLVYETTGDHTLTLNVTVTLTDTSTISASCSIPVKVYRATFTIYAKAPPIIKPIIVDKKTNESVPCYVVNSSGDRVGHSFWMGELSHYDSYLTNDEHTVNKHKYGLYPKDPGGTVTISNIELSTKTVEVSINTIEGKIVQEDNHGSTNRKLYDGIKAAKIKDLLAKTLLLQNDTKLKYHLTAGIDLDGKEVKNPAPNCTSQAVAMGKLAGCAVPNGEGKVGMVWNASDTKMSKGPLTFANPYSLSQQLKKLSGK